MFWRTLAQDQGHCHGGDHLDGLVQFLILSSSSESFSGELGWFTIVSNSIDSVSISFFEVLD